MNISLRVDDDIARRLDAVATSLDRPRAWVALEGIKQYLSYQEWFARSVEDALKSAVAEAPLLTQDAVVALTEERKKVRSK